MSEGKHRVVVWSTGGIGSIAIRAIHQRPTLDLVGVFGKIRATTPLQAFQAQVRVGQAWRRFPFLDPALPRELLDHDWPGPRAAKLFHRRHDEWHGAAQRYWAELQSQTSS